MRKLTEAQTKKLEDKDKKERPLAYEPIKPQIKPSKKGK